MTRSPCRRGAKGILTQHACLRTKCLAFSVSGAALPDADVDLHHHSHRPGPCGRRGCRAYDGALGEDLRVGARARASFAPSPTRSMSRARPASGWRAARVVFVGGGPRSEINVERIRRMARAPRWSRASSGAPRIGWADVEPGVTATSARIETIAEGFVLREFRQRRAQEPRRRTVLHPRRRRCSTSENAGAPPRPARRWASRSMRRAC